MAWGESHTKRRDDRRGEHTALELIGFGFLAVLANQEMIMATQEELQASVEALSASVAALVSAEAAEDAGGLKPGQVAVDQTVIDGLNDHVLAAQAQIDLVTQGDQANTTPAEPAPTLPDDADTQVGGETPNGDPVTPLDDAGNPVPTTEDPAPTPIGEDGQPIEG